MERKTAALVTITTIKTFTRKKSWQESLNKPPLQQDPTWRKVNFSVAAAIHCSLFDTAKL